MNVSALLKTDSSVSETDRARITAALADAVSKLDRLDVQIKELTRKRSVLATTVENFRAALSPIKTLPRDVLEEVFAWCIPSTRNAVMSVQEAPLSLGRVCSYWRRVSRSTPKLWSTLHLALPTNPYTDRIDPATRDRLIALRDATDSWLNRSGTTPLSISIFADAHAIRNMSDPLLPLGHDILSTLLSFSRRWKAVRLDVADAILYPFNKYSSDDFPILSQLRVDQRFLTNDPHDLLACVMKAPAIQIIHFPLGFRVLHSVKSIVIPLEQLTSLSMSLSWDSPVSPLDLLASTPSLEKLSLDMWAGTDNRVTNTLQGAVVVPRLRHFSFNDGNSEDSRCSELFSCFQFPSLQSLSLNCIYHNGSTFPPTSLPAGAEPLLALRIVAGAHMHVRLAHLINYLRSSSQIRVLDMTEYPPDHGMSTISLLLPPLLVDSDSPLCPKVEVLRLKGSFANIEPLVECIRSRMAPHSPLKRVDLTFGNDLSEDDADRMERLRVECQSKGIKMTFRARREYKRITKAHDGVHPRREVHSFNDQPWDYGRKDEDEDEDEGFK